MGIVEKNIATIVILLDSMKHMYVPIHETLLHDTIEKYKFLFCSFLVFFFFFSVVAC